MNILIYSTFKPNPHGHGGEKRSYQIDCFLKTIGIELTQLKLKSFSSGKRYQRIVAQFKNFKLIKSLSLKIIDYKTYKYLSNLIFFTQLQLPNLKEKSIIIYEHCYLVNWLVPILLKNQGHVIIAFPHNLEALVSEQKSKLTKQSNGYGFFDEIATLKHCDIVFTISKEEEWLLRLYDIEAQYYPYLVSNEEKIALKAISEKRKLRTQNGHFLVMGTAGNPPTRKGMLELISYLQNDKLSSITFHLVGFGTEYFKDEIKSSNIKLHGAIPLEQLYQLYIDVDAAIIHQIPSSGALTKIPELLYAGVGIISNNIAARNYHNISGIRTYWTKQQFIEIICNQDFCNPKPTLNEILENFETKLVQDKILNLL